MQSRVSSCAQLLLPESCRQDTAARWPAITVSIMLRKSIDQRVKEHRAAEERQRLTCTDYALI